MRTIATLLLASTLATGCTSTQRYVAGGTLFAIGGVGIAGAVSDAQSKSSGGACTDGPCLGPGDVHPATGLFALTSIVAFVAGSILFVAGGAEEDRERRRAKQREDDAAAHAKLAHDALVAREREAALRPRPVTADQVPQPTGTDAALNRAAVDARIAAREHRCESVRSSAAAVSARDQDFYRTQFLADPFVAACLAH